MPLDVCGRSQQAVYTSGSALFAQSPSDPVQEVDIEGSSESSRGREARCWSTVRPSCTSHTVLLLDLAPKANSRDPPAHHCTAKSADGPPPSRRRLTRTRGTPRRGTGTVCHMSSPLNNAIFSSLDSCDSTYSGSMIAETMFAQDDGRCGSGSCLSSILPGWRGRSDRDGRRPVGRVKVPWKDQYGLPLSRTDNGRAVRLSRLSVNWRSLSPREAFLIAVLTEEHVLAKYVPRVEKWRDYARSLTCPVSG